MVIFTVREEIGRIGFIRWRPCAKKAKAEPAFPVDGVDND